MRELDAEMTPCYNALCCQPGLALGGRQVPVWGVRQNRLDAAQIVSTTSSAENEETHEDRFTVERHGGR